MSTTSSVLTWSTQFVTVQSDKFLTHNGNNVHTASIIAVHPLLQHMIIHVQLWSRRHRAAALDSSTTALPTPPRDLGNNRRLSSKRPLFHSYTYEPQLLFLYIDICNHSLLNDQHKSMVVLLGVNLFVGYLFVPYSSSPSMSIISKRVIKSSTVHLSFSTFVFETVSPKSSRLLFFAATAHFANI